MLVISSELYCACHVISPRSPDRGKSLYHILWPGGGHLSEIKDFSVAGDLKFAALITSNQVCIIIIYRRFPFRYIVVRSFCTSCYSHRLLRSGWGSLGSPPWWCCCIPLSWWRHTGRLKDCSGVTQRWPTQHSSLTAITACIL